jgi:hypothetical protein
MEDLENDLRELKAQKSKQDRITVEGWASVAFRGSLKVLGGPRNQGLIICFTYYIILYICYKPEDLGFGIQCGHEFFFSIYLILPAALGPDYHSASNRNEYQ